MHVLLLATILPACAAALAAGDAVTARDAMRAGDFAEAYCIWRDLAGVGDADAQYNLGWMYHNGYGLAVDDHAAVEWWERAAAQSHTDAIFALGNLYRLGGRDLKRDSSRAVGYFLEAARKGDEDAALLLRTLIGRNDRAIRDRAVELLTRHHDALGVTLRVRVEKANVRAGAGTDHRAVQVAVQGQRLVELRRSGGWVQVGHPEDGWIGWIKGTLLESMVSDTLESMVSDTLDQR